MTAAIENKTCVNEKNSMGTMSNGCETRNAIEWPEISEENRKKSWRISIERLQRENEFFLQLKHIISMCMSYRLSNTSREHVQPFLFF